MSIRKSRVNVPVGPVRQGTQLAAVGEVFGDPGAVGVQGFRKARHEGVEKRSTGNMAVPSRIVRRAVFSSAIRDAIG